MIMDGVAVKAGRPSGQAASVPADEQSMPALAARAEASAMACEPDDAP